ncbi:hypothetical protein F2Q68_00015841 [Brassica cretica]|uniref:ATP-dependent Clp protease proteolytic subunit n=1 Tax=Brassica cretica TaxID=69181 RepID=A0A8S9HEX0_BRACR|nr:hypothetical protein F2Q68_00015841 [Brassica cretica]
MQNFKNVPQYFYGLNPAQMDMFMTEDSPGRVSESISSRRNYLDNGGIWSMSGMNVADPRRYIMSVQMYRGGGSARPRTAPPDLPSLLLDARICYLSMPIVPAVTEICYLSMPVRPPRAIKPTCFLSAQALILLLLFMWLDYDNPANPIYLYINSPGTQNEKMETVGSETEAYAIADTISYCKSDVYTINCGMAFGQAAMLLSLGKKGYRAVQPHSSTKLYLPKVNRSSGAAIDMWIKDYDGSLAMGRPGGSNPTASAGLR